MAATLDQITGGRLDINVVPGGIQGDYERLGDASSHGDRYARSEEFIGACRALWQSPDPVVFKGEYVNLDGAVCSPGPTGDGPRFYLGGASDRALALAGRQSDVYLMWIGTLDQTARHVERATEQFEAAGRAPSFGLRTHIIARATEREAWEAADDLLSRAESRRGGAEGAGLRWHANGRTARPGPRRCRAQARPPPLERHIDRQGELRNGHRREL